MKRSPGFAILIFVSAVLTYISLAVGKIAMEFIVANLASSYGLAYKAITIPIVGLLFLWMLWFFFRAVRHFWRAATM